MSWKNDQVSTRETEYIVNTARICLAVEGDFVEMGCYRGDTSLLLAEIIQNAREGDIPAPQHKTQHKNAVPYTPKRLYLYDSFEGLPEKANEDNSVLGGNFTSGALFTTKRELKGRFLRAGFKLPIIKKAWFSDLTPDDLPEKVAFAFLDGDFYQSIKDSLRLIEGKMAKNSAVLVHDYYNPALPGVKKATDEWLTSRNYHTESLETLLKITIF